MVDAIDPVPLSRAAWFQGNSLLHKTSQQLRVSDQLCIRFAEAPIPELEQLVDIRDSWPGNPGPKIPAMIPCSGSALAENPCGLEYRGAIEVLSNIRRILTESDNFLIHDCHG
jgi:hypothetical protein